MSEPFLIFGAEMSPYSVKVRSYFRYKAIPHRWIPRNASSQAQYEKFAKLPIVPLVVMPDGASIQDSTPIIERVEALFALPSIYPADTTSRFICLLMEEFADEWANKWMFHYRWARDIDQQSAAGRLARMRAPDADDEQHASLAAQISARMVDRVWFVGSSAQNGPLIETSFQDALLLLDAHLAQRPYLFGAQPAFADFGLWGQFYALWTDPTPCALIEGRAPHVLDWIQRMLWPRSEGPFEPWQALAPTLQPFLDKQVGALFMPWTIANENAVGTGAETFTVMLNGKPWTQKPQKYHAKSLAALRRAYRDTANDGPLDRVLQQAACLEPMQSTP